ncbi:transglutaminase family protein [bacterium]|nr:transglutaminase family protein [bacterium]
MTRFRVTHQTVYTYGSLVTLCHNKAHLTPRDHLFQRCHRNEFKITPEPSVFQKRADFFSNITSFFTVQQHHDRLVVRVESEVAVGTRPYPKASETTPWEAARKQMRGDLTTAGLEAFEQVFDSPHVTRSRELADYALVSFPPGRPILEGLLDLNRRINTDFKYAPATTTISTPISEVMRTRRGVCQDFAHLMIGCLRSIGLAARYVSGYLRTTPPPGRPRLIGADASHAWCAAFLPGIGWLDFDPTNNSTPKASHITLGWGRDYSDVSPIRGVILGGGGQGISVSVDVAPIDEPATATPPTIPAPRA